MLMRLLCALLMAAAIPGPCPADAANAAQGAAGGAARSAWTPSAGQPVAVRASMQPGRPVSPRRTLHTVPAGRVTAASPAGGGLGAAVTARPPTPARVPLMRSVAVKNALVPGHGVLGGPAKGARSMLGGAVQMMRAGRAAIDGSRMHQR